MFLGVVLSLIPKRVDEIQGDSGVLLTRRWMLKMLNFFFFYHSVFPIVLPTLILTHFPSIFKRIFHFLN